VTQLEDLQFLLLSNRLEKQGDEIVLSDTVPANPVEQFFARAEFTAALGKDAGNLALDDVLGANDALAKRDSGLDPVLANRLGISVPFGSAATLTKRTETGDDSELTKRAGENLSKEGNDIDLSKRASKRGMINLVKTSIDGEPFILGYDFEGVNVYCRALEDDEPVPLEI